MKLKKSYLIIGIAFLLILAWIFIRFAINGGEDSWIKDERGVYIKHGNPSETPSYVLEQQEAITCAIGKFERFNEEKNSQCLGVCGDYAIDIVHVPRNAEDNLVENQCEDYRKGIASHFIELDKEENIVKVV